MSFARFLGPLTLVTFLLEVFNPSTAFVREPTVQASWQKAGLKVAKIHELDQQKVSDDADDDGFDDCTEASPAVLADNSAPILPAPGVRVFASSALSPPLDPPAEIHRPPSRA